MKSVRRLFTLAASLLIASAAFAQLSDQQVIQELKKYSTSGMTQEQVMTELAAKGVTVAQLERIKAQYDSKGASTSGTKTEVESREREEKLFFPDPAR
ncbi:MAG: hypothetical protein CVT97_08315, partial [Bacteroidetes bacterium HGW-Bacteroidetes-14]